MTIDIMIDNFMSLNDDGKSISINPKYFKGGFELLVALFPYGGSLDEKELIVSSLLYSHPYWFDKDVTAKHILSKECW